MNQNSKQIQRNEKDKANQVAKTERKEDAAKVTTKVIIIVKTESPSLAS